MSYERNPFMKKSVFQSKKLLVILMLIAVIVTSWAILASAEEESIPGFVFEAYNDKININGFEYSYPDATYVIQKHLDKMPQTVSAWVYVPSSVASSEVGAIIGNTEGRLSESGIDFLIGAGAVPTISVQNKYKGENKLHYDVRFENAKVPTDAWSYVTFVYDDASGVVSCYINGALGESKTFYPALKDEILVNGFVFGGDNRELNHGYFKGGLGDVTVYSDVRTAAEIKADFEKGLAMTKEGLDKNGVILYYDVDENDIGKNITDDSGNGYDVLYEKTWISEAEMTEMRKSYGFTPAYSFAVVGDTQKITRFYPENLPYIYDFIVDNAIDKNIVYSIGLGDITDKSGRPEGGSFVFVENKNEPGGGHYERNGSGTATEWDVAKHSITIMDGTVEYSLIAGNHDNGNDLDAYFASHEAYTSQFVNHGGMYNGKSVNNTWRTFAVGNVKYLIMNIAYNADGNVFAWANEVLAREEHKDHNVIITTHAYLDCDGTALDSGDINCGTKNSGVYLWENLVSKHENVKLMLAGHVDVDKIVYSQRQGDNGNTVTQILVNGQSLDRDAKAPAMVAMFYFSEDGEKLAIEYYSTVRNVYLKNPKIIDLTATAPVIEEDNGWMGNSIVPSGKGSESDPYKIANGGNLLWMAEQIAVGRTASLDGMYFEQTADIDLNGNSIYSIGYYFGGQSDMAAFGGHYDGNGYSIKNGTVEPAGRGYESSVKYGYGLFGVIFGATVENVVLENVEIVGAGLTGGIVGRAAAPLASDVNFAGFNIISGCELKDSVKFVLNDITPLSSLNFDTASRGGRFGSICGMAHNTVIDACTSAANVKFGGDYGIAGGIVGSFGLNSTVSNCSFTGSMTLCDNKATETCMYGGIAGIISPTTKWSGDYTGYAQIKNCYNSGNLYFEVSSLTKNTHWAGILGGAPWIPYVAPTESMPYPYLVENSYNLSAGPDRISTKSVYAGITAKNAATAKVTSTLYVKDCYSIAVKNAGGDTGTNEYRYVAGTTTLDGKEAVYALGTVATATSEEAKAFATVIDANVTSIRSSELEITWYSGNGKPAFTPTSAGIKYYDVENGLYYVYDGKAWKNSNGIETEYGVIPNSYSDAEAYPFLIFKNGNFAGAGNAWNTAKTVGVIAEAIKLTADGSDVTVVLRRDYEHTATVCNGTTANTYKDLKGTLNIDLGGNTITSYRELMQFNHNAGGSNATVNIYNGTIEIAERALVNLLNQTSTEQSRQDLDLTFKNITFCYKAGTVPYQYLINATDSAAGLCVTNITFEECIVDLTNYGNTKAYNLVVANGDANNSHVIHMVVRGGEYIIDFDVTYNLISDRKTGYPNGEADTLRFEKDTNGKYTKFIMPASLTAPTNTYNSVGVAFAKESVDETTTTYTLIENFIEGYGEIPLKWIDKNEFPFLIFKNGECVGAGNAWNTAKAAGVIASAISLTSDGSEVSVVLRRDYEHTAAICNNTTANTYKNLKGTLNIDLGGNKITSYRELMQFNHTAGGSNATVNIYNGTIEIADRALVNLLNQTSTEQSRQDLDLTFKNITICYKAGTSHYQYLINATDSAAGLCVTNITFEECIVDLTNYGNTKAYNLVVANADDNNSHVIHMVVKGGEYIIDSDVTYNLISDRKTGYPNGEADTLRFEKDTNGKYTKFIMPATLSAPQNIYDSDSKISYALISTDGATTTYELGESVSTKYGDIPFLYSDITKYPFVLFQNNSFKTAYATWYDFCQGIGKVDTSEANNTVLLVRDDHTSTASSANLYTVKYITIDLNGKTLTRGSYHLFNLSGRSNAVFTANITIKNGTLNTTHSVNPPISFNSNNTKNVEAKFNVICENVTFTSAGDHSGALVLTAFSDGSYGVDYDMVFNNCIFDATKGSINNLFGMADGSGNKFDVHVTVNGGKLIANKYFDLATFSPERVEGEGSPDTLLFGENAFTVVLPKSATAPSVNAVYTTANGVDCVFVKSSENGEYVNYSLYPKVMLGYKIKTSVTLYSNFVYNIYIPEANFNKAMLNGNDANVTLVTIDGDNYYHVAVNIPAPESLNDIKLTVTLNSGNTTVDATWTLSVLNYAKSVLVGDFNETTKTLMKDMLVYASAAHTYFENTEAVAEKLAQIKTLLGDYSAALPEGEAKAPADKIYFTDVAVYLGEVPSFRFYLATGFTASDFTFKVGNRTVEAIAGEGYVEIVMYAYMMLDDVTFTVNKTGATGTYNLYSYYEYAGKQNNANLVAVVEALMKYSVSANNYRNSVVKK